MSNFASKLARIDINFILAAAGATKQIACHIAARDELTLHVLYRKFAAQGVLLKDFVGNTHLLQLFRTHIA